MNKIAVLIDAENTNVNTLELVFETIANQQLKPVVLKAFADWSMPCLKPYATALRKYGIEAVHFFSEGRKNTADFLLTIHACDLLHSHPFLTGFALVSSDSDFLVLAHRLKNANKQVLIFAKHNSTDEFKKSGSAFIGVDAPPRAEPQQYKVLIAVIRTAINQLKDTQGLAQLAAVGSFLSAHYSSYSQDKGNLTLSMLIQRTGVFQLVRNSKGEAAICE